MRGALLALINSGFACATALACAAGLGCSARSASAPHAVPPPAPPPELETDEYTRYELLDPESSRFRIVYDVTAISPGATLYFNPIRKGSVASDERVTDLMTGDELRFETVSGDGARRAGVPDAERDTSYIRIHLPRPVPAGGQVRLRIEKTYRDPKSYFSRGGRIVFDRSLSIRRDAVLLPAGYELVSCNEPSQVLSEPDGRLLVSFFHAGGGETPLVIEARRLPR